ncbi:exopolyphosphatase [Fructilactobacillus lindneri]|nr:exopolyphosphatase [Fructilactobacillus lindneri]ANZ57359.1 exopolyphosphatase [Fructilactobacillus lindneri]ANZ58624.1 exopolyphosphatase [Fructilactobacillus lindneri]POG97662.1 exopolyphosphatase [Fructilactobacillus lindneri]POG98999.1 exopolyphosphatase [Fructilactobacillus lindneri]POG99320.1 exopolyphosphatase [Fructilactobacillus lindneri]
MVNFVIIDMGLNSVRMAIYQIDAAGHYREIKRMKNDTRLSEGMGSKNILQFSAMKRTIAALKRFKAEYNKLPNVTVQAIATAAVRQAQNQQDFLNNIKTEIGINVRVLTGKEEAYFDYEGVVNRLKIRDYVLMDIGGASVEIIHVRNKKAINLVSLPTGAVKMTERFHLENKITAVDFFSAQQYMIETYSKISWLRHPVHYPIVLIGGAARTLARINRRQQHFKQIDQIQDYQLTRKQINATMRIFLSDDLAQRQSINGLDSDRADVIVGGLINLTSVMDFIDSKRVIFSDGGVREGIINEFVQRYL